MGPASPLDPLGLESPLMKAGGGQGEQPWKFWKDFDSVYLRMVEARPSDIQWVRHTVHGLSPETGAFRPHDLRLLVESQGFKFLGVDHLPPNPFTGES